MNWLPLPERFRDQLADAVAAADPFERLERLHRIANARLSYLEVMQLDAALMRTPRPPDVRFERVRLALLGSATMDHLAPAVRVAGLRRGLLIDVYTGAYGQYRQELLAADSRLHAFSPGYVLFSFSAQDFLSGVPVSASPSSSAHAIEAAVTEIHALWEEATRRFGATTLQQSFLNTEPSLFGGLDAIVPGARARLVDRLNGALADRAWEAKALWLDVAGASARDGLAAWFDPVRWLQAKMEVSPTAAANYGEMVARVIGAHRGRSKKCLVLDLDGTLWGGVVGDDGVGGIVLGEGSGLGEAHLALHRYAKKLRERGVILAVCSKNDPNIAEAAFRDHPESLLKREDFAAFVANWEDKATNLERIAAQLNIGLDSLVFVDDNPVERARVRSALPMVATPELPEDPAYFVRRIAEAGYFEATSFTQEDSARGDQYTANSNREALRMSTGSLDAFLQQLDMAVAFGPVTTVNAARVTQLLNKTNQFNTTTIRRTQPEVESFAHDDRAIHLQFRLADRFGDNGIVSVMLLAPVDGEPEVLDLVNWVMSCRVFGRQLEHEAMNVLVEVARGRGVNEIRAQYVETEKNRIVRDLFGTLGFVQTENAPGGARWTLRLKDYVPHRTRIKRKAQLDD
jgi:FkbH-like protein